MASDKSDEQTVAEIKGHARIPSVLVIAIVTALSSGGVALATRGPTAPADAQEIKRTLEEIQKTQRAILDTVNKNDQESRNRDTVQDSAIAALRAR
jgi:hypothetical protein